MNIDRRNAIKVLGGAAAAAGATLAAETFDITKGPFQASRESLKAYQVPDWFRDAKFGIWAHWGPQSAAEMGDWYARRMYFQGERQYEYHVKTYGHPSKFGFKDVIATWKADQWDPEHLMDLYHKAGARYFCSMGVHHDNFDLWNSKYQPRWNAVAAGPKKDVVGLWEKAAKKRGMRFAVSEHLSNSYNWFATSHMSDKTGPLAGVAYDGTDPQWSDLYHPLPADYDYSKVTAKGPDAMSRVAPDSWKQLYYRRIKDLVDQYQPDLLYTDGGIPFEEYGLNLVAHFYNGSAARNGGKVETIYTSKSRNECTEGTCLLDFERGLAQGIAANPWQTDTCIGNWHYDKTIYARKGYKSPKMVVDMLVDIVSRNGNLLLNFPLPNSGMPDPEEMKILDEITRWMAVNGEGIYATRPWKMFGDGSSSRPRRAPVQRAGPEGSDGRGGSVHDEGEYAVRLRDGVAGEGNGDQAARNGCRRDEGCECFAARIRRPLEVDPGGAGSAGRDAGGAALRSCDCAEDRRGVDVPRVTSNVAISAESRIDFELFTCCGARLPAPRPAVGREKWCAR